MTTAETKKKVNPNPKKDSKRSKKRASRGFVSLAVSSRKHRRAAKRMAGATGALNYNR
jgi:hypothetical protein